ALARPSRKHHGVHPVRTARRGPCRSPHASRSPRMNPDIIGWAASAILLATLVRQIVTQWKDKDAKGVSKYLFLGQMAASVGFIVCRWMLDSWLFLVTNPLILLPAVAGQVGLVLRRRGAAGP